MDDQHPNLHDPKERFRNFNAGRANFTLLAIVVFIAGCAVLKITAVVVVPIIIAVLLALVIYPFVMLLDRFRIPRYISITAATLFIVAGLYFIGVVVFSSARTLLALYPSYESRFNEIYRALADLMTFPFDEDLTFSQNLLAQLGVRNFIISSTYSLSKNSFQFLGDALMVVLYLVFLLFEATMFKEKLETVFEGKTVIQIKKIGSDTMRQVSRYLTVKFFISVGTGALVGGLLHLVGLEFALVWGVLQFILNFIPNLGSIAAGLIVSLFGLLQFWPDPQPIIMVVVIMLGVNMVIGNIVEPKILGDNLGLSPLVVLLSLVIWGYLLGFAGMILSVPMMVIVKIICENVPMLEPISVFLGSRKPVEKKKKEKSKTNQGSPNV